MRNKILIGLFIFMSSTNYIYSMMMKIDEDLGSGFTYYVKRSLHYFSPKPNPVPWSDSKDREATEGGFLICNEEITKFDAKFLKEVGIFHQQYLWLNTLIAQMKTEPGTIKTYTSRNQQVYSYFCERHLFKTAAVVCGGKNVVLAVHSRNKTSHARIICE